MLKCWGGFLLILAVLLLPACGAQSMGQASPEPQLKVTAGGQELRVIYYGDRYNKTREEISKRLMASMEETSIEELPYVPLDSVITVKAENFQTEEFSLSDNILNEDGEFYYSEYTAVASVAPVKDGKAEIVLQEHPAVFLSSLHPVSLETADSDDAQGKTIRAIIIRSDIDDATFAFAFILRTDAGALSRTDTE